MTSKDPLGFLIGMVEKLHHLMIDLCCGIITTVQNCSSAEILVLLCSKSHQSELLRHTILCDHGSGHLGSLLNIIGSTCSNCVKNDLLCSTSTKIAYQHSFQLFLGVKIFFFLRYLHNVTQGPHGTGYDGDLLYRLRILLECIYQCVSDFMVGYDPAFLFA